MIFGFEDEDDKLVNHNLFYFLVLSLKSLYLALGQRLSIFSFGILEVIFNLKNSS